MPTLKAGCFLIDNKTKKIALVYRQKHNDYSFPKGHVEKNETLKQCAVRETEEETKRKALLVEEIPANIENYTTQKGEQCQCHMFFALDGGKSDNQSTDTHDVHWTSVDKVEQLLSYSNLKNVWNQVKPTILQILNKD